MTFFESELRKVVGDIPDVVFVGRACYVTLSDTNRAKIEFTSSNTADHYDALQMTVLNHSDGKVDTLRLYFKDVLGTKQVSNPNFRDGVNPHAWTYNGKTEWYAYTPNEADYALLRKNVASYLGVFRPIKERKPSLNDQMRTAKSQKGAGEQGTKSYFHVAKREMLP